jgi:hypothetical protein
MADWNYDDFLSWGGDETQMDWYQNADLDYNYDDFLRWGGDETQQGWYTPETMDWGGDGGGGGGSGLLGTILGGLGSVGSFLGNNARTLGPLLSGAGSLAGGALGSNASSDAARLQAAALNRGMDLQTAQWLQQQANQAPWLRAGQEALPQLQQLAGEGQQAPFQPPGVLASSDYGLPSQALTWGAQSYQGPQAVNAGDYRWTPGQGPRAADYRYTPGQTPNAQDYRYTPGAVPTLSGQELLANDPGVQFRLDRARNALEGSAAARGSALSGPALAALQEQGQDLASQEYGNAWQRAAQQAQMREGWQQQATAQNFGQAMSAAQLREQLQQVATQQGWSQAQTEAAFREQMAQAASQQGFGQALQGQQTAWQQGLTAQQWEQAQRQQIDAEAYQRAMGQNQLTYGRDWQANQAQYERQLAAYNSQLQNQNTQWNRYAGLAGLGQTTAGQLGEQGAYNSRQMGSLLSQLGEAQGLGALGPALSWQKALGGLTNNATGLLAGLNR